MTARSTVVNTDHDVQQRRVVQMQVNRRTLGRRATMGRSLTAITGCFPKTVSYVIEVAQRLVDG